MEQDGYNIKYKIQPGYDGLLDYLLKIDSFFPNIDFIVQNRRNDIRIENIKGIRVVIK